MACALDLDPAMYVTIVEEPTLKEMRLRFEFQSAQGTSMLDECPSPDIKVLEHCGSLVILYDASLASHPKHPPNVFAGNEYLKMGICKIEFGSNTMTYKFRSLSLNYDTKDNDDMCIDKRLAERENAQLYTFHNRFGPENRRGFINLSAIRILFLVYLEEPPMPSNLVVVACDPFFNKETLPDLSVVKMSHCSSPVCGNKEITMYCRDIAEDLEVRFFENFENGRYWENIQRVECKQKSRDGLYAITFRTPQYFDTKIKLPAVVSFELRCSSPFIFKPRLFFYTPMCSEEMEQHQRVEAQRSNSTKSTLDKHLRGIPNFQPIPTSVTLGHHEGQGQIPHEERLTNALPSRWQSAPLSGPVPMQLPTQRYLPYNLPQQPVTILPCSSSSIHNSIDMETSSLKERTQRRKRDEEISESTVEISEITDTFESMEIG